MQDNIRKIVDSLPRSLADQVIGYVAAVDAASDSIFSEVGVERTPALHEQLLFIAALRKTVGIVSACFWAVDNSLAIALDSNTMSVRIGGASYSSTSAPYLQLKALHRKLETAVIKQGLSSMIDSDGYAHVVAELAHGHK